MPAEKYYTYVIEFRSPAYPRSLKLEIRKEALRPENEEAIAYSPSYFTAGPAPRFYPKGDDGFKNKGLGE